MPVSWKDPLPLHPEPGQPLANINSETPAIVLAAYHATPYEWVILCVIPENTATPFVTWYYNAQRHAALMGHYHKELAPALDEYRQRVQTEAGYSATRNPTGK